MFLAKKNCTSINNLNGILDGFPEGHDLLIALLQKQYPSFFQGKSRAYRIPLYREAEFPLLEILHERPGLLVVLLVYKANYFPRIFCQTYVCPRLT